MTIEDFLRCTKNKPCLRDTANEIDIHKFISRLPRPDERIPQNVKDFILEIAKKMCEVHEAERQSDSGDDDGEDCECWRCMLDQEEENCSTCPSSAGEEEDVDVDISDDEDAEEEGVGDNLLQSG